MILDRRQFELYGKGVIEKLRFRSPLSVSDNFQNEACLIYVVEGQGKMNSATESIQVPASEAILLKCGNYFAQWIAQHEVNVLEVIAIHFDREILQQIYQQQAFPKVFMPSSTSSFIRKIKPDLLLERYIQSLTFYFDNPHIVTEDLVELKLKELLLLLAQSQKDKLQELFSQIFSPTKFSIQQVIDEHLFNNLNIENLAELCNMSLSTFKREFQKIFHDSPAKYIKRKRLEKAAEMLQLSQASISEIAYDVGFSDPKYFSKVFHATYEMAPMEYRKRVSE